MKKARYALPQVTPRLFDRQLDMSLPGFFVRMTMVYDDAFKANVPKVDVDPDWNQQNITVQRYGDEETGFTYIVGQGNGGRMFFDITANQTRSESLDVHITDHCKEGWDHFIYLPVIAEWIMRTWPDVIELDDAPTAPLSPTPSVQKLIQQLRWRPAASGGEVTQPKASTMPTAQDDRAPAGAASGSEVTPAPQGDPRLTHFYATLDRYAGNRIPTKGWEEIQAAIDALPEMLRPAHSEIAQRLVKDPNYVKNRLRVS